MAVVVTEDWSKRDFVRLYSAVREWQVSGVNNEEEARAASGEWQANAQHPLDGSLKVLPQSLKVSHDGLNMYRVHADYGRPTNGEDHTTTPEDPLSQLPTIKWELGSTSEPIDTDINGNPILNSAGFAFSQPVHKNIVSIYLVYTRNESRFDVAKAVAYANAVNSDTFQIPGGGSVAAGQAQLISYQPTKEYTRSAKFVTCAYKIELREGKKSGSNNKWDGFRTRILDQGSRAWYDGPNFASGEIFSAGGSRTSKDVLLDGAGKPKDQTLKIEKTHAPISPPYPTKFEIASTPSAVFVVIDVYKSMPFSGLTLT